MGQGQRPKNGTKQSSPGGPSGGASEQRKPSFMAVDLLNPIEVQNLQAHQRNPDDYLAIMASAAAVNVSVAQDGLAALTVTLHVPAETLTFLRGATPMPGGLPNVIAARDFRQALGARPLVRLVLRRDQFKPPAGFSLPPPAIEGA